MFPSSSFSSKSHKTSWSCQDPGLFFIARPTLCKVSNYDIVYMHIVLKVMTYEKGIACDGNEINHFIVFALINGPICSQ